MLEIQNPEENLIQNEAAEIPIKVNDLQPANQILSDILPLKELTLNELNLQEKQEKASIEQIKVDSPKTTEKKVDLSPDVNIGADIAPSDLLNDIIKIEPLSVIAPLLNERKFLFFSKVPPEKVMQWQKKELDEPLLKAIKGATSEVALQMFRNLLSYMLDRKSSKAPIKHVRKFLKMIIKEKQYQNILKDEAYLQVYKQLSNNKKFDSYIRGLKFLAILSSCFVPSNKDIYLIMLNFLFYAIQDNTNFMEKEAKEENQLVLDQKREVLKHVKYIFVRMIKTKEHERKNVPCVEELEYIEYLKSIPVPIHFFTGAATTVKIESYTTVNEVKLKMMDMLDFSEQRSIFYSMYEVCRKPEGTEERFVDDGDKVCDIISLWKSDMEKAKKKDEKSEMNFKFYLKLLVYYPFDKEDLDTLSVVYYQTVYDVISGKLVLTQEQVLTLAAYQLINQCGGDEKAAKAALEGSVETYIPGNIINKNGKKQWATLVLEMYGGLKDVSRGEAKWQYLQQLSMVELYQTHQFDASFNLKKSGTNNDNIPDECIIALKPEGILILSRERNEVVFYKYETIMNWGISKNQLILCVSNIDNEIKKVCFYTMQTKVMQILIEIYCNLKAGKTMKEIRDIIKVYDKKFENISTRKRHAIKLSTEKVGEDQEIINEESKNESHTIDGSINDERDSNAVKLDYNIPEQPLY